MNRVLIYLSAFAFLLAVLPVYVYSYAFVSTEQKKASLKVTLFRFIKVFDADSDYTRKQSDSEKGDRSIDIKSALAIPARIKKWYQKLCITKIVQVADFGTADENNAYAAVVYKCAAEALCTYVASLGGRCKLKYYVLLNRERPYITGGIKLVGVINFIALSKFFIGYLWSKIYERKT